MKSSNKPQIRFNGYTDDWEQRKLEEIIYTLPYKKFLKNPTSSGRYIVVQQGNEPILGYADGEPFINYDKVVIFGDHTLSLYKPESPFFVATDGVRIIEGIENINGYYLMYLLEKYKPQSEGYKRYYSILSSTDSKFIRDNLEQRKIGEYFRKIDNLITLHQRKLDGLKIIKKSLLSKMFPKNGEIRPEIRFKGFTEDWEQRKLFDVVDYKNGKAHESDIDDNGKYIVVNSKFVSTDGKVRKYSNKQNEPLIKNDIAFVLSDVPNGKAIAKIYLVEKTGKYTLNQRIAGLTPHKDINAKFLSISINRNKYFLQFDDGVKQTNLSLDDMEKYSNFYPKKDEQDVIGNYFEYIDNLITLHQRKLESLEKIKKSLLNKMFV